MSWKSLKELVKNETVPDKCGDLQRQMQELWNLSKEIVGSEESSEVIDDAAVFLLRLFLDQKLVLLKHLSEMKKIFGPFSNQLANKICKVGLLRFPSTFEIPYQSLSGCLRSK